MSTGEWVASVTLLSTCLLLASVVSYRAQRNRNARHIRERKENKQLGRKLCSMQLGALSFHEMFYYLTSGVNFTRTDGTIAATLSVLDNESGNHQWLLVIETEGVYHFSFLEHLPGVQALSGHNPPHEIEVDRSRYILTDGNARRWSDDSGAMVVEAYYYQPDGGKRIVPFVFLRIKGELWTCSVTKLQPSQIVLHN